MAVVPVTAITAITAITAVVIAAVAAIVITIAAIVISAITVAALRDGIAVGVWVDTNLQTPNMQVRLTPEWRTGLLTAYKRGLARLVLARS